MARSKRRYLPPGPLAQRHRALVAFLIVSLLVLALVLVWSPISAPPSAGLVLRLPWPPPDGCPGGNTTVRIQLANVLDSPLAVELSLEDTPLAAGRVALDVPAGATRNLEIEARIPGDARGAVPFTARARAAGLEASVRGNVTVLDCGTARAVPAGALPASALEALLPSLAEREARAAELLAACEKKAEGFDREDCVGSAAVQARNASLCGTLTIAGLRDWCLSTFFAPGVSESLCERVSEGDMRAFCLALARRDIALCRGIASRLNRDVCMADLALAAGDASLCGAVVDNATRAECLATASGAGART